MNRLAILSLLLPAILAASDACAGAKAAEKPRRIEGVLSADDPIDRVTKNPKQVHEFAFRGGQSYILTLEALDKNLDPFLRVEDADGEELGRDDDSGGNLNARLLLIPAKDGKFKVITTAFKGTGKYLLRVEESDVKIHTVGKDGLKFEGKIEKTDPPLGLLKGAPHKTFLVRFEAGKNYEMELKSKEFDTFLFVLDAAFKVLAYDDDGGGGLDSRLKWSPPAGGVQRVVVASLDGKMGSFVLQVRELSKGGVDRRALMIEAIQLDAVGVRAYQAGQYQNAQAAFEKALKISQRVYEPAAYPNGHRNIARLQSNVALALQGQGKFAKAEPLLRDALSMKKRLFKGDHSDVAIGILNLANLYQAQGRLAEAEPLCRDGLAMNLRLFKGDNPVVAIGQSNLALMLQAQGKYAEAEFLCREAFGMLRRLFKGDHADLTTSLNNLGSILQAEGQFVEAELHYRAALLMHRRLFSGDHPAAATMLNNLAGVLRTQRKLVEAEALYRSTFAIFQKLFKGDSPEVALLLNNLSSVLVDQGKLDEASRLCKDALTMRKRIYNGDHPNLASSLDAMAFFLKAQGKLSEAEGLYREALAMTERLFRRDHPSLATRINNLAALLQAQGRLADAEPLYRDALGMSRRLSKGDNPDVVVRLNNLGSLLHASGKLPEAALLLHDALEMRKRLFKSDHPDVAGSLSNLASLLQAQGNIGRAESLHLEALAMSRRLIETYAKQTTEGAALTLASNEPLFRDCLLSCTLERDADLPKVYQEIWSSKGAIARIHEQRQQATRAAVGDPGAATLLAQLVNARRRRAELLLAPSVKDPVTRKQREVNLATLEKKISDLDEALRPLLPAIARAEKLAAAHPADLQKLLPEGTAVVDFLRFVHFEFDRKKPGKEGEKQTPRYLAFVVTKERVALVELDTAAHIEDAVTAWRSAITGGKEISASIPAKVRALVWDKVRKELPADIKTVYICPDDVLCRVPWAALPGDKPGTILLEDFALAAIPHAPFLLDQLWPRESLKSPPTQTLLVGGVKYDAEGTLPIGDTFAARSAPLLKPGAKIGWAFLPGSAVEAKGVAAAAQRKKLTAAHLEGDSATASAVLAALPKAKFAHFATHGFFADASFRSAFQLEEKDYERTRRGERIGRAANSPLVMTGLVFAGANDPKNAGRGIVTGEALVDLDLSGLELAVLSACETGLGDVAGGEGTFGLQRAFHLAGVRNVVASLWKVPDQPTAALMHLFYRNLWEKDLPPIEALRQAQLEIYRHPDRIAALAKDFRGTFKEVPGAGGEVVPPADGGRTHPMLWAAFTLSGEGRH